MGRLSRALLNPFDRAIRLHEGTPIVPGRYPGIGHVAAVRYALPELLRDAERRVGPLFWLEFPSPSGPTLNLVVLDEEVFDLLRGRSMDSRVLADRGSRELLGDSMILLDGKPHHHMRSALNAPFMPRSLNGSAVGAAFAETIERRVGEWVRPGDVAVLDKTQDLTLELIFAMLDAPPSDLVAWRTAYRTYQLIVFDMPFEFPGSPRVRGERARDWLNARLRELVSRARTREATSSFLASLVHGRDDAGAALTEGELVENLRLLLLAGHETSATAMAWLLIELARAPALFDRLVEESVRVGTLPATPRDLRNHPFAEALFREAVRVHTPIPVLARMLIEDTSICGRNFAAGTRMLLPLAHLARDANRYPQPDAFHPDRWLERSEKPGPFETLPFGGGPHFCLGYHIAWMETVQFAVAFALHARRASVRPTFTGPPPRSVWFPLAAPSARVRVRLARTGA